MKLNARISTRQSIHVIIWSKSRIMNNSMNLNITATTVRYYSRTYSYWITTHTQIRSPITFPRINRYHHFLIRWTRQICIFLKIYLDNFACFWFGFWLKIVHVVYQNYGCGCDIPHIQYFYSAWYELYLTSFFTKFLS